jgi:hypothetical protein
MNTENNYDEVVIKVHGKVPAIPDKSCRSCKKLQDCGILRFSLNSMDAIGLIPRSPSSLSHISEMPFPMPCRGEQWEAMPSRLLATNPLVQRLGLVDVGEPMMENTRFSAAQEENEKKV